MVRQAKISLRLSVYERLVRFAKEKDLTSLSDAVALLLELYERDRGGKNAS